MPALVPQRQGELASQALEHPLLTLFPKVRNDFGIAVRDQAMPARFQFCAFLRIVEELPVKDHGHTSVFVGDRLLAIRQADDTQPPRPKSNTRALKVSLLVGAAMNYRLRHPLDDAVRYVSVSGQIHDTCDATHSSQPVAQRMS